MRKKPKPPHETYPVRKFVKRVNIAFIFFIALSMLGSYFLVFLPLTGELEKSLLQNYNKISVVIFNSFRNSIERGIEGARSLASRTMIKEAVLTYIDGKTDDAQLKEYVQPRFVDGAQALENLIFAQRLIDDMPIAQYNPRKIDIVCFSGGTVQRTKEISSDICFEDDHRYLTILSPVIEKDEPVAYDRLIFDLKGEISNLNTSAIEVYLSSSADYNVLNAGGVKTEHSDSGHMFLKDDYCYNAFPIQQNSYLVIKQLKDDLFAPVRKLSSHIFLTSAGILLLSIVLIYMYVVRFAKRELTYLTIEQVELKEQAKKANTDWLTKASNRRVGEDILKKEFEHFKKGKQSSATLLFDVDDLKMINDRYGHFAGDLVLSETVSTIMKLIGKDDKMFRWGGDEFIVILHNLKREDAYDFCNKLVHEVHNQRIDTGKGFVIPSISMGVSFFTESDIYFTDVIERADRGAYMSKEQKKNKVTLV